MGDIGEVEEEGDVGKAVDKELLLEYNIMVTEVFREYQKGGEDVGMLPKLKAALQLEARVLYRKHQTDKSCEVRQAALRACASKHERIRNYSCVSPQESSFFAMATETLREELEITCREHQRSSADVAVDPTVIVNAESLGPGIALPDIVDLVEADDDGGAGCVEVDADTSARLGQEGCQQSDAVGAVVAENRGSKRARAPAVSADVAPVRRSARVAARSSRADGPATAEVQIPSKRRRK
jgi:hypothetical protein